MVLKRVLAFTGPHKLEDKWSEDVYQVVDKPRESIPVYQVRPVEGGRDEILHRNLLLPVGHLRDGGVQPDSEPPLEVPPPPKLDTTVPKPITGRHSPIPANVPSESSSESESESYGVERFPARVSSPSYDSSSSLADSESSPTSSEGSSEESDGELPRRSNRTSIPTKRYIEQCSPLRHFPMYLDFTLDI